LRLGRNGKAKEEGENCKSGEDLHGRIAGLFIARRHKKDQGRSASARCPGKFGAVEEAKGVGETEGEAFGEGRTK